jgi:AcrR family transcriptional regulator
MSFVSQPPEGPSLAERAVQRSTAHLTATRTAEAQALMDAGSAVMIRYGTERRATVSEVVREAGLSNQAFYRHFESKDDLVAAIVDAGARRLAGYLEHRMAAEATPAAQVRVWIQGMLSQATDPEVAHATRAITWNGNALSGDAGAAARRTSSLVWQVLEGPLREAGSSEPARDSYLIGRLVFAVLFDALWAEEPPALADLAFVEEFCLAGLTAHAHTDAHTDAHTSTGAGAEGSPPEGPG